MKLFTLIFLASCQTPCFAAELGDVFNFSAVTVPQIKSRGLFKHTLDTHNCARKPGAEIAISGREFFYMLPGQMDNLAVDLTGTVGQKITLHISAENKGLTIQGPNSVTLEVGSNQLASFTLPIKALLDGRWVINLIVQSETADGEMSGRALALVVQVGNMVGAGGGQQKVTLNDAQGVPMIVMAAKEEIL
jgi:hypothetical protein